MSKKQDEAVNSSSMNNIKKILDKEGKKEGTKEEVKEVTNEGMKEKTKEVKNTPSQEDRSDGFDSKNIDFGPYNELVYTSDYTKDIRRTYKIKKKHVNILNLMKIKKEGNADFRELIMEAVELLWKEKFETEN